MQFSVWANASQRWLDMLDVAEHAQRTGWDGFWVMDHFMPNSQDARGPVLECWATLAALAARVGRLRLGSLVCGNTYRHPAVLANTAAATDIISGGRLVLGIGAGWQGNEHAKYGIPFYDVAERLERLAEACQVIKALTTEDRAGFQGRHYQLDDAPLEPKPVQRPLPLLVGGAGERVTMRIAAMYADEWNTWGSPQVMHHKIAVLRRHCEAIGRDPDEIRVSAQALVTFDKVSGLDERARARMLTGPVDALVDALGEYAHAGVDEFILPDFNLGTGDQRREQIDRFREEVAVVSGTAT